MYGKVTIDIDGVGNKNHKARIGKKVVNILLNASTDAEYAALEGLYQYVVWCHEENLTKAYKVLSVNEITDEISNLKTLFVMQSKDSQDVYEVSIEEFSDPEAQELNLESFFSGEYRQEIEPDLETLIKKYNPVGKEKFVIVGLVAAAAILMIIVYMYNSVVKEQERETAIKEQQLKIKQQQAVEKPLSDIEKYNLKQEATKSLLDYLSQKVINIATDSRLSGHASIRALSATYQELPNKISLRGTLGYEYNYPVSGSALITDVYSKSESFGFDEEKKDLEHTINKNLSVECVNSAMSIQALDTEVVERTPTSVKIKYSQMKPDDLLKRFRPIEDRCPIYIDMIGISDGKFDLVAVLYGGIE